MSDHEYKPIALANLADEVEAYMRSSLPELRATRPRYERKEYNHMYFAIDGKVELRRSFGDYMSRLDDGNFVVVLMGEYWSWRDTANRAVIEAYETKAKTFLAENPLPPEARGWMWMDLRDGDSARKTPIQAEEHAQVEIGIARVVRILHKWNGVGCESGSWRVDIG